MPGHHVTPRFRETEGFARVIKYLKHVSMLTYLTYIQPKSHELIGSIHFLRSVTEHYISLLLSSNQLFNSVAFWQLLVLSIMHKPKATIQEALIQ